MQNNIQDLKHRYEFFNRLIETHIAANKSIIVFHCMHSVSRGPKTARAQQDQLNQSEHKDKISTFVLQQGYQVFSEDNRFQDLLEDDDKDLQTKSIMLENKRRPQDDKLYFDKNRLTAKPQEDTQAIKERSEKEECDIKGEISQMSGKDLSKIVDKMGYKFDGIYFENIDKLTSYAKLVELKNTQNTIDIEVRHKIRQDIKEESPELFEFLHKNVNCFTRQFKGDKDALSRLDDTF